MSVVKKISIQGIRSFNPNDNKAQMIDFQTPLTLILGVNGSGKTTIIEALKYAITNAFPPNSNKGSSFVNDPKLTNGYETMGAVKLEVIDGRGNRVHTTRRVKVAVKDKSGNLTKKELDATIRIVDPNGDEKEISSKCADVKTEMCRIMGVSEAILNNVILCHQEDSCWPLDEGKKVKEKFDAIFNTTMYIKCLDQLEKQSRELGQRAKTENEKLVYVIENRELARQKKSDLKKKRTELKTLADDIAEHEKELKEMDVKLKQLRVLETEYIEISNQVSVTEGKMQTLRKQVVEIKANIKEEISGDIASIERALSEFNSEQENKISQQKQLQYDVRGKEEELRKMTDEQKHLLIEEGKFQQEEIANQERTEDMIFLISDIVKLVKRFREGSQDMSFSSNMDSCIDICDGDPSTLAPDVVIKALASAVRVRESEITKLKVKYDNEERELQKNIDELRSKKAKIETEIEMKNKQTRDNTASIDNIRHRLRAIEGSNSSLETLEYEEAKVAREISSIEDSGTLDKYESDIANLSKEIDELDKQITDAQDDFDVLNKDKGVMDQIEIYNNQKIQKKNECNKIMGRMENDLMVLLGEIPEEDLEDAFDKKKESVIKELYAKKNEQRADEKKATVLQMDLKRAKNDLDKKEKQLEGYKEKIADLLEDGDYDEVYTEVKKDLETSQKDNYYAEAGIYLYKKYIQKLNRSDCCPLCKRDIDTKRETQELIKQIQSDVQKMQLNDPSEKAKIAKLQAKQNDLLELKPIWDDSKKLEDEIPTLQDKVSTLQTQIDELSESMEDFNLLFAELENAKSICDNRSKDVHSYESAKNEIRQRETSIGKLESSRTTKAKQLSETMNVSSLKTRLQDLKNSLKTKQLEKNGKANLLDKTRTELNKLNVKKNDARQKILKITSELQNREGLENQKKELEATNKQIQETNSSLKLEVPKVKSEITEAEKVKSNFVDNKEKHLQTARSERDSLEKHKLKLAEITRQIEDFERKKVLFVDVQKRAAECKRKVDELDSQKGDLVKDLESVTNAILSQESKKRNLEDNLSYKLKLKDMTKLKLELDNKKKLLASTENQGVVTESRKMAQKSSEKFGQMNRLIGSKREIEIAIKDLTRELNNRPYVNAEKEYIEKYVRKTVYEKAQKDIRRYKTALDQAIMMFHKQRMEMINKSLWEYWRKIYKGNDIDYIQIRTDSASSKPAAGGPGQKVKIDTGKGRKTYNYRVVMVRRGAELDMRGRCSAGQRVLACIIIRIALADSFSSRCGIITLDEPTTNLDQKNINSLADALSSLAERMSAHRNFQLIVITHDQEFTDRLSAIDAVEKYWKVSRDQMGFSQITMVPKRG